MAPRCAELEEVGGVTVVRLLDRRILGEETVQAVAAALDQAIGPGRLRLLVDFSAVQYVSSALAGALLKAHRKVHAAGGRFAVCGLGPMPAETLRITRLDRVLAVYPDCLRALGSLQAGG